MSPVTDKLSRIVLLVATRKGAWLYHGDLQRRSWRVDGPHFLGHIISHLVLDQRDGRTLKLWTDTRFLSGHRFYEKLGFVRQPVVRFLADATDCWEFAYRLDLPR